MPLNNIQERIKGLADEWGKDALAGLSYSGIATWLKYVFQHFIDIGWTVLAAIAVMVVTHYGKKLLSKIDKRFKI